MSSPAPRIGLHFQGQFPLGMPLEMMISVGIYVFDSPFKIEAFLGTVPNMDVHGNRFSREGQCYSVLESEQGWVNSLSAPESKQVLLQIIFWQ